MKMDQIAFYAADERQMADIKAWFGLIDGKWITDTVLCNSSVWVRGSIYHVENIAELNFNYDLGTEFEILRFIKGQSWHWNVDKSDARPFISHIGIHLDDGEPWPWQLQGMTEPPPVGSHIENSRLVQRTKTIKHTASHFNNIESPAYGRTYQYEIYEIGTGAFVKYIRRIHAAQANPAG